MGTKINLLSNQVPAVPIAALPEALPLDLDANQLLVVQGTTPRLVTLLDALNSAERWQRVGTTRYLDTPADVDTITFNDTSGLMPGLPVRFEYGGTMYYGIITEVEEDSFIKIAGAPLSTEEDLDALLIGRPEMVVAREWHVPGVYGDAAASLFISKLKRSVRWELGPAALVAFGCCHAADDTTDNPYINLLVDGYPVSSANTEDGIAPGTGWVDNPATAVLADNYGLVRGSELDVYCTVAGGTGDATDLSISAVFVLE